MTSNNGARAGGTSGLFALFILGVFGGIATIALTIFREPTSFGRYFTEGLPHGITDLESARELLSVFLILSVAVAVTFAVLAYQLILALRQRSISAFGVISALISAAVIGAFVYLLITRWEWPEVLWNYIPVAVLTLIAADDLARGTVRLNRSLALNAKQTASYDQLLDGMTTGSSEESGEPSNDGRSRVLPPAEAGLDPEHEGLQLYGDPSRGGEGDKAFTGALAVAEEQRREAHEEIDANDDFGDADFDSEDNPDQDVPEGEEALEEVTNDGQAVEPEDGGDLEEDVPAEGEEETAPRHQAVPIRRAEPEPEREVEESEETFADDTGEADEPEAEDVAEAVAGGAHHSDARDDEDAPGEERSITVSQLIARMREEQRSGA